MSREAMTSPLNRRAEFAALSLLGIGLVGVLALHLLVALLTGLTVFVLHRALVRTLMRRLPAQRAQWIAMAVVLLTIAVALISLVSVLEDIGIGGANDGLMRLLNLFSASLDQLRATVPASIAEHLPVSIDAVRSAALLWLREHLADLRIWGTATVRITVQVLVGVVIGLLASTSAPAPQPTAPVFLMAWRRGLERLADVFGAVMGAQVRISLLNTLLTGLYLFMVVPLIGERIPLSKTLVAITFVAGLLPVIGNLISNTAMVLAALVVSPSLALLSLVFLMSVHKFEYFLNARLIGARIQARTYELLTVMLMMEALFGLGGVVAAPVYYAWTMGLLREARWV